MSQVNARYLEIFKNVSQEQGFLIYSRGGVVPYLTPDNFEKIFKDEHTIWNVPISSIYEQPGEVVMKEYGKPFAEFANLSNCTLLFNSNDSANTKDDLYKYNEEKSISIWAPSGRRKLTPEAFMDVLETFGIKICIPISDKIPGGTAKKRCQKSCDRSVRFLDKCLEIRKEKKLDMPILGVLEGGDSIAYRQKCVKEVVRRGVDGYVFSGYDIIGSNWIKVLDSTLEYINDEKLKIMFGLFTPPEVIQASLLGVDLFDSIICTTSSEQGCALNFKYKINDNDKEPTKQELETSVPNKKKQKQESEILTIKDLSAFVINLHDKIYFEDMRSLVVGCTCYCCGRYTRAYLHHLLVTKEMLAEVLLMMHNLHYWKGFFKSVLDLKRANKLQDLLKLFDDY